MKPPADDLAARRPVWQAFSELYLDTGYRSLVRAAARELALSRYTTDELRAILFDEVHPALHANLYATAGVWDGFDQAWVAERILRNRRRPRWLRARGSCGRRYARHLWRLLAPRVAAARVPTGRAIR
jgi:ParB-like chromosome segregation protein Spo0J